MRNSAKLSLAALVAALLLASAVGTASAGRFSSNTQNIRTTWSRLEFRSGLVIVRCQVTLEGSLHSRSIVKMERSLIGAVTRVVINACALGTMSPLRLPWHITYESFRGALPNITGVRLLLNRAQIGLVVSGRTCLYGTATDNLTYELELTERFLTPVAGRNVMHLLESPTGGLPCSGELEQIAVESDGHTEILGTGRQINITLI